MKKKGFTLIELLIVITIMGILFSIGGLSIRKQIEAKAMIKVKNQIGDFFRVAAKQSQETGRKYKIDFKLDKKIIEISRNGEVKETLKLPEILEYGIIYGSVYVQTFSTEIEGLGYFDKNFTLYVFKSDYSPGIGNGEKLKYAISFSNTDEHIKYEHIREYISINETTAGDVLNAGSPSRNSNLKLIKK
jgi:prepilin-type N-terminal cleavage/methylation domain-containing protein